jgi:hypothetical protein
MAGIGVPAGGCFDTGSYVPAYVAVNLAFYAELISNGGVGPGVRLYVDGVMHDQSGFDTATDHEYGLSALRATVSPGYHCYSFVYTNTNDVVGSGAIISYH